MKHLTTEDLRRSTLQRQFPDVGGTGPADVVKLVDHLGPIQSQVPRAPFLTLASRLPGTTYATVSELCETQQLLKTSNLRGTVHTSGRRNFTQLDAVATQTRQTSIRNALKLASVTPAQLDTEVRLFCTGAWRSRDEIVEHARRWLAGNDAQASADAVRGTSSEWSVWGNSGLVRRPRDGAWERRTDTLHRTAVSLVADLVATQPAAALVALFRAHLAAFGPLTRKDLAFFFGVGLAQVDTAVTAMADEVAWLPGPNRVSYLDLVEPPTGGSTDPGLKLLPEFEGLLIAFHGSNRNRFLDPDGLARVWLKANGLFSPVVLYDGRLVASWRTRKHGQRTDLEVSMLDSGRPLAEDLFSGPVSDVECVLDLQISDVRVLARD